MSRSIRTVVGFLALLTLSASPAHAHLVDVRFGDFYGGALHLLTGVQYALLLFALSIFAGLQPASSARWALLIVPGGVLVGALAPLIWQGANLALLVTICLLCVGALIALGSRTSFMVFAAVCAFSSLVLGFENGLAAKAAQDTGLALWGLTAAAFTAMCLLAATFLALRALGDWTHIAYRAVGSWIAAVSIIFLTLSFTQEASAATTAQNAAQLAAQADAI